ncbi:hypothetical protein RCH06_001934 [Polaromonas sp. CG_9.5]|uniref:DUF2523 family protein n=1 Tax=Polaromonas sp. CG_9.5 TaxID=3071705 RepID=UPI002DF7A01B|nr:hypothetical protein [Polaromonas sp. CG_9.5]
MGAFFTAILAKVVGFAEWIGRLFVAVFVAVWDLLRDVVTWPFDQLLDLAKSGIEGIDVSGITTNLSAWGSLPAEVSNILGLLGAGTAINIIASAIAVRLVLQLIPFVRLGS